MADNFIKGGVMPKHKVILTQQDREELAPLLHISKAERELMPQEILEKLDLLAQEQEEEQFQDLEQIIEESLHFVESLEPSASGASLRTYRKPSHIKACLWWETNYRIYLAQRKVARIRRKSHKKTK